MHQEHPELIKDQYWDQIFPAELPYTEATKQFFVETFLGSTYGVDVPQHMQNFILLSEQAALREDTRKETTPVTIKGSTQESDETFPFTAILEEDALGSSVSLTKPSWKRRKRNRMEQDSSLFSVPKRYISEDYQDGVFKMSDISLASSRNQGVKFPSHNYEMNTKSPKQSIMQIRNKLQVQSSNIIGAFPFQMKRPKRERKLVNYGKPNQQQSGDLSLDFETDKEQLTESSQCLVPFRRKSNLDISYPILKKLENLHNLHDQIEEQNAYEQLKHENETTSEVQTENDKNSIEKSSHSTIPTVLNSKDPASLKMTDSHLSQVKEKNLYITSQESDTGAMAPQGNIQRNEALSGKQGSSTIIFNENKTDLKNKRFNKTPLYCDTINHNKKFQSDDDEGKNECIIEKLTPEANNDCLDVVIFISDGKIEQRNGNIEEKSDI